MRRYRAKKRALGFVRHEVLLPADAARHLIAGARLTRSVDGHAALDQALVTMNVPRPFAIDRATFLRALIEPNPRWLPHMEAFFGEVDPDTIHQICLAGLLDFPLLAAALKVWHLEEAAHAAWIQEMARERLANVARRHPSH
jgi:hypothetical protein